MTSASTPAHVVSDAQDWREKIARRVWITGIVCSEDDADVIAHSILAPDGPIAAMQAEHQRTRDRLDRLLHGHEAAAGECIHCEWPVEAHEAHRRIASLEAQLAEARALLDPTVSNTKEDGHGR